MSERVTKPYRIGWTTVSWWRVHRPWQSESGADRFARRAFTAAGAERKMVRDVAYRERRGIPSPRQRMKRYMPKALLTTHRIRSGEARKVNR